MTKHRTWTKLDGSDGHYRNVFYRCPADHLFIVENKIVKAMTAFLNNFTSDPEARDEWLNQPTVDQSAAIVASIEQLNRHIGKLNAGITRADIDYYGRGALAEDGDRHQAIVSALKKQVVAAQAEITTLQDKLHEEERNSQRAQRLDDINEHALHFLQMEDVRTANAWLRQRFQIVVENKKISDITLLL